MQLVYPQQFLAQADVPVHFVQILVDGLNEVQVHGGRHIGIVQGTFKGSVIAPGFGKKFQLLVLGVQDGGGSISESRKAVVEVFISAPAQAAVRTFFQADKGALAQRVLVPVGIHRVGEFHVRVGKGTVDGVRGLGHLPCRGQQFFLSGGKGMGLAAAEVGQVPAVAFQFGAGPVEAVHGLIGNRHDLRGIEAGGGA